MVFLKTKKCETFVRLFLHTIKDKSWKLLSFMERETRLELATSSLARRHSTTELPPHTFAFIKEILINDFYLPPRVHYYNTCS